MVSTGDHHGDSQIIEGKACREAGATRSTGSGTTQEAGISQDETCASVRRHRSEPQADDQYARGRRATRVTDERVPGALRDLGQVQARPGVPRGAHGGRGAPERRAVLQLDAPHLGGARWFLAQGDREDRVAGSARPRRPHVGRGGLRAGARVERHEASGWPVASARGVSLLPTRDRGHRTRCPRDGPDQPDGEHVRRHAVTPSGQAGRRQRHPGRTGLQRTVRGGRAAPGAAAGPLCPASSPGDGARPRRSRTALLRADGSLADSGR